MNIGGSVMLTSLDDYISPSQSCINPIFTQPTTDAKRGAAAAATTPVAAAAAATTTSPTNAAPSLTRGLAKLVIESDLFAAAPTEAPPAARPDLIKVGAGSTAKVSLNDCLACSGCVTSAETVLISQQSVDEMRRALADPSYSCFVASFSPQALASLAEHFGIPSSLEAYRRLTYYFTRTLGFHVVVDTAVAADLVLSEACKELDEHRARRQRAGAAGSSSRVPWTAPPASVAVSSTRFQCVTDVSVNGVATAAGDPQTSLSEPDSFSIAAAMAGGPLLASACPGWVCYAEKSIPEAIPLLSSLKSPQQVTGSLIKHLLSSFSSAPLLSSAIDSLATATTATASSVDAVRHILPWSSSSSSSGSDRPRPVPANEIYHVTIMPCFDKKLEASRRDFWWEGAASAKEVDCVLSSNEVAEMLRSEGIDLASVPECPRRGLYGDDRAQSVSSSSSGGGPDSLETLFTGVTSDGSRLVGPVRSDGTSDGYADALFRYASDAYFGLKWDADTPLPYSAGKNPDFREVTLHVDGKVVLCFAQAYGFRNIQTVVSRLRRGKSPWDYVEIMACPAGCANGGGQARPAVSSSSASSSAAVSTAAVADARTADGAADSAVVPKPSTSKSAMLPNVLRLLHDREVSPPGCSAAVTWLRSTGVLGSLSPSDRWRLLRTGFHHIPKLETAALKW